MKVIQNRIYADDPDQAAMQIRKKHDEFDGRLVLRDVHSAREKKQFEYQIVLTHEE